MHFALAIALPQPLLPLEIYPFAPNVQMDQHSALHSEASWFFIHSSRLMYPIWFHLIDVGLSFSSAHSPLTKTQSYRAWRFGVLCYETTANKQIWDKQSFSNWKRGVHKTCKQKSFSIFYDSLYWAIESLVLGIRTWEVNSNTKIYYFFLLKQIRGYSGFSKY